jgi:catechol 2,3-dioxygenase-like lactoylglutathione lyase family enzyme
MRPHEPPTLYCVELRSADWERSVQWYRQVLGLRVLVRVSDDGYALVEAGQTRLSLLRRTSPGAASPRISLAFEVENIDAMVAHLEAAKVEFTRPSSDAEGLREVCLSDPDGNSLRLFAWPLR